MPESFVELCVGIIARTQGIRGAVDDASKFVFYRQRIVETQLGVAHLVEELHHYRDFHRAGRVERGVWLNQHLAMAIERLKRHSDLGPARMDLAFDLLASLVKLRAGSSRTGEYSRY